MIPLNIPIFSTILLVQLTLAGQNLVEYHPGHPGAVDHGGMVIVLDDVVEVLVHQDDDILTVGGVDDAAVVAAGVHAAALAGHPDEFRLAGLLAVGGTRPCRRSRRWPKGWR